MARFPPGTPDTVTTTGDIGEDQYLRIVNELTITKDELENTQSRLAEAEKTSAELRKEISELKKKLDEQRQKLESMPWTENMWSAAQNMGPGEALIATVAAPVMAAPLAVATVVKGFQSVGTGFASLFPTRRQAPNNQFPTPAASGAPETSTSTSPNPTYS